MSSNGEDIIRETFEKLGDAIGVQMQMPDETIANLGAVLQAQIDLLAELQSTGRLIPAGGMALTAEQVEDVRKLSQMDPWWSAEHVEDVQARVRAMLPVAVHAGDDRCPEVNAMNDQCCFLLGHDGLHRACGYKWSTAPVEPAEDATPSANGDCFDVCEGHPVGMTMAHILHHEPESEPAEATTNSMLMVPASDEVSGNNVAECNSSTGGDVQAKKITRAWMLHLGYSEDHVDSLEQATHEGYGCEHNPFGGWDCIDESGASQHQDWDEYDNIAQIVMFVLERIPAVTSAEPAEEAAEVEVAERELTERLAEKWTSAMNAARTSEHHFPADCLAEAVDMLLGRPAPAEPAEVTGQDFLEAMPTEPDCWDVREGHPAPAEPAEEETKAHCMCVTPDWYHDGLDSDISGRLCRRCRLRQNIPYRDLASPPVVPAPNETGPWPTWESVPDGVVYQGTTQSGLRTLSSWVNDNGLRIVHKRGPAPEFGRWNDYEITAFAPFVAVEGN